MTEVSKVVSGTQDRDLVVISGYYGFGNLGDEAILEQLVTELSELVARKNIVVLSNDPDSTASRFHVEAMDRWSFTTAVELMKRSRVLISGGGGLFQDVSSIKSVAYYALLLGMARFMGVRPVVYAQGLGPLESPVARWMTKAALSVCDAVSVRDQVSLELCRSWSVEAELTADPVWRLAPTELPVEIEKSLEEQMTPSAVSQSKDRLLLGLSLREHRCLLEHDVASLADVLADCLPEGTIVVPLAMQPEEDSVVLAGFIERWTASGRLSLTIDSSRLELPSQWVRLISRLDLVVGMRLHSLIMALSSGVPVLGLSYDPKVEQVVSQFEQPFLNLVNGRSWSWSDGQIVDLVNSTVIRRQELSETALARADQSRSQACHNQVILDRILDESAVGESGA